MLGLDQVSEVVFDLSSYTLKAIIDKVQKQFDVIVSDISNKDIILPTPLLPLTNVVDDKSKVHGVFSSIIPSMEDLERFLKSYLHDRT